LIFQNLGAYEEFGLLPQYHGVWQSQHVRGKKKPLAPEEDQQLLTAEITEGRQRERRVPGRF
jgi:hypothetical protein